MEKKINKVGVIGAGVMGSTIAAHLSNVGIETVLLDIVPPGGLTDEDKKKGLTENSPVFRNRFANNGVETAAKSKPASFYLPENKKLIQTGNIDDNLDMLKDCDWICEVVVENLDIKRKLFDKLEKVIGKDTIISSNTSGIAAKLMCEGRSETFRKNFAITHFFNPPRYMKLLELVPGPDTRPEVIEILADVCERRLGKGIVWAKDTPNFVANRIGVYSIYCIMKEMVEMGLTIEEVDKLTGPIIGHPKSASFRTADLVGLDTLMHVADNTYDGVPDDEGRDMFKNPEFMIQMVEKKLLGEKTKGGFYKKDKGPDGKKQLMVLDYNTLEYRPKGKVRFNSLDEASTAGGLPAKLQALFFADDKAGEFIFKTASQSFIYAANRIPEIANDILNVDNGIKWGFGWKLGPFEKIDAIGTRKAVDKMKAAGFEIPAWVLTMLDSGKESFYKTEKGIRYYYDIDSKDYKEVEVKPGIILLPALKAQEKVVATNSGATLVDLGDGVACLEFHTKMNALGEDIVKMIIETTDRVRKDFDGLVIGNHGSNFSAGANLPMILFTAQQEKWEELDVMVKTLQDSFMGLKYLEKPVVAAPAGMALGGGCEICLHADKVRYAAETYMGLVEVGVGLLPGGGGCKELLIRNTEHLFDVAKGGIYPRQIDQMPFIARAFENIAMAKVATSGPEAVKLGLLRATDQMTVNRDYLIQDAKNTVLAMNLEGYVPRKPREDIRVPGEAAIAVIDLALWTMHSAGFILDHDLVVSKKIARVLCGGNVLTDTRVSEQYLLDLEREAFLSLAGEPATQARIQHMLGTGKPLRN